MVHRLYKHLGHSSRVAWGKSVLARSFPRFNGNFHYG